MAAHIYLSGPAYRRTVPELQRLTIKMCTSCSPDLERVYVEMLRHQYRVMRRAGISAFRARIAVYEILSVGIHAELGEAYR